MFFLNSKRIQTTQAKKKIESLERDIENGEKAVAAYEKAHEEWLNGNSNIIRSIEEQLETKYDTSKYLDNYFRRAKELVEAKKAAIERQEIIDTRGTVELVETLEEAKAREAKEAQLEQEIKAAEERAQKLREKLNLNTGISNPAEKAKEEAEKHALEAYVNKKIEEEKKIQEVIIANIKAGREPGTVLVASLGGSTEIAFARLVKEYIESHPEWLRNQYVEKLKETFKPYKEALKDPEFYKRWVANGEGTIKSTVFSAIEGLNTFVYDIGGTLIELEIKRTGLFFKLIGADRAREYLQTLDDKIDVIQVMNDEELEKIKKKYVYNPDLTEQENQINYINGQVLDLVIGSKSLLREGGTIVKSLWKGVTINQGPKAGKVIKTWRDFKEHLLDDVLEHIYKGGIKRNGYGGGAHHVSAVDNVTTRLKLGTTWEDYPVDPQTGFIKDVELEMWNEDLYQKALKEFEGFKRNPKNSNKSFRLGDDPKKWDMNQFWKRKDTPTTFYPKDWTKETIELKISQAWENGIEIRIDKYGNEHRIGYTNKGIPLEFAIENHPPSVFANFDSTKWILKN